jgi:hypothetical protein
MLVKSLSRTSGNYGQLINYITRDKAVMKNKDGTPFLFKHNLTGKTAQDFEKAFKDNNTNRATKRKGGLTMYHDILSWRPGDSGKIDIQVAEQIARKYAELRNENALYLGALHQDKDHIHLHLMISAVEAYTGKPIRISKAEFAELKKEVQRFEQERFDLVISAVDHGKGERMKNDREYQMEVRSGKISRREEVKSILEKCHADSLTQNEFYENVKNSGLELYERGGKIAGIDDGRHYRFSTLGYTEERFEELKEREDRMESIEEVRSGREMEIEMEIFNKEILDETVDDIRLGDEEQKENDIDTKDR